MLFWLPVAVEVTNPLLYVDEVVQGIRHMIVAGLEANIPPRVVHTKDLKVCGIGDGLRFDGPTEMLNFKFDFPHHLRFDPSCGFPEDISRVGDFESLRNNERGVRMTNVERECFESTGIASEAFDDRVRALSRVPMWTRGTRPIIDPVALGIVLVPRPVKNMWTTVPRLAFPERFAFFPVRDINAVGNQLEQGRVRGVPVADSDHESCHLLLLHRKLGPRTRFIFGGGTETLRTTSLSYRPQTRFSQRWKMEIRTNGAPGR